MSYLQSFVFGPTGMDIRFFLQSKFYCVALDELIIRYGNTQKCNFCPYSRTIGLQRSEADDHRALISYEALLWNIVQSLPSHGFNADLKATHLVKLELDQFPKSLKIKWSEHTSDNNVQNPEILDFFEWLDGYSCAFEQLQETSPQHKSSNGFQASIERNNRVVSDSSQRHYFSTDGLGNSSDQDVPNGRRNNEKSFYACNNFSGKQYSTNQEFKCSENHNWSAKTTSFAENIMPSSSKRALCRSMPTVQQFLYN